MQSNPYESRYGTPERLVPEPSEPLEEEARKDEALAGERRDEHDGPGPVYSAEGADDATANETRRVHVLGSGADDAAARDSDDPDRAGYGDAVPDADRTPGTVTGEPVNTDTMTGETGDDDRVDRHGSENADSREAVDARDDVLSPDLVRDDGPVTTPEERDADVLVASAAATEPGTGGDVEPVDDVDFERSWHEIKAQFVDDPRGSVEQADALVEAAVAVFTTRRQSLLDQWKNSDQADTEALRLALREYHTLLNQLTGK